MPYKQREVASKVSIVSLFLIELGNKNIVVDTIDDLGKH